MKLKWTALFAALILGTAAVSQAGVWDTIKSVFPKHVHVKPLGVRVLVLHDEPGATIGVKGKYKLYDPNTKELLSTRFTGKRKYMEASNDGLRWHEHFPGLYQILIVSDDPAGNITINDVEYKGEVYVYNIGNTISVVNELPVEDYLQGLLAGQYHDQMDSETLAAIAITARTETLYRIENPRNKFWAVDATEVGYKGQDNANPSSPMTSAIRETQGMVLGVDKNEEFKFFPAKWDMAIGAESSDKYPKVLSRITLEAAQELASQGEDATSILSKAFPGAKLQLTR